VEQNVQGIHSTLYSIQAALPKVLRYELKLDRLQETMSSIGWLYSRFEYYQLNRDYVEASTILDFSRSVTSHASDSVLGLLAGLHNILVPGQISTNSGILSILSYILNQNDEHMCGMTQSPFQLMYNLYNIVALTELKGYAMLQFAYMTLRINNEGNFTAEAAVAKENFVSESNEKLASILQVLPAMSRTYMKCDPSQHKESETYLKVKGFLQGYIENEVDMSDLGSCKSKCSEYTYAEAKTCYKNMFCSQQPRCNGRIFDCEFYHADAWVCMSSDPERRYDWIEYEDGTVLGQGTAECKNKIKVDSWWRWVFWHCSYCFCKCDEITDQSERFWSLVPVEADPGYVVTGARFVKRAKIFHIQIQQAKPSIEGGILEETKGWKETANISESNLTQSSLVYTMSYEQRAMDLDTLSAPEGYVLTGLKLRNIGSHLNMEIRVNPIRFRSGEILDDQYLWIGNDNTPASIKPRKQLPIIMPDVSTRLVNSNKVDGFHDMYFNFDTTSATKDVGQTTVPFIDAQPVVMEPATWLSGAGLYHKGRIGFGGFVGIKVETYDYSRHMSTDAAQLEQLVKLEYLKAEGA